MIKKRQSSPRNGSTNSPTSRAQLQKLNTMTATSSWAQMVMDLYPPGSSSRYNYDMISRSNKCPFVFFRDWTCTYCRIIQVEEFCWCRYAGSINLYPHIPTAVVPVSLRERNATGGDQRHGLSGERKMRRWQQLRGQRKMQRRRRTVRREMPSERRELRQMRHGFR
ncbi:hypothetical protein PR202_ga02260 [Eleusine coracana subsp. coracana]|uniref:Uncharacterized protein n=1 Tax=Eleusine coracana subsp. coracana TaxID=191504 RepID=A0AAV5BJN7_ELECO|nr:hypothetical protein PR202_ga02260 [Eleusine coracana subsp. coracana]